MMMKMITKMIMICHSFCLTISLSVPLNLCLSVPLNLCLSLYLSIYLSLPQPLLVFLSLSLSLSVSIYLSLSHSNSVSLSHILLTQGNDPDAYRPGGDIHDALLASSPSSVVIDTFKEVNLIKLN